MRSKFGQIFFPLILVFLTGYLSLVNFTPGTFLSGWDTLHPEFDFPLNFKRVIAGVWREEQGLGAVAAHAHMADLPRMLLLYFFSFIFPLNTLRYLYVFLCLILGPLGMFYFLRYVLRRQASAFLGALFYLLNLGTLQHFYVPFEMFTTQYAFLPWLFLFATKFLQKRRQRDLVYFSIVTLLASPAAYAPQLWYVYFAGFLLYVGFIGRIRGTKQAGVLIAVTLAINSFWLLPHFYFLKNNASASPQAKINQLFSPRAYLANKARGRFWDVAILRGPLYDWLEYDFEREGFVYLMAEWREHLVKPVVLAIGYLEFLGVILGIATTYISPTYVKERQEGKKLRSRFIRRVGFAFLPLFLLGFVFLMNANLPFWGEVFESLRARLPLFREGLRFPWTKFSLIFLFSLSFYFARANQWFLEKMKLRVLLRRVWVLVIFLGLVVYMWPSFLGFFIDPSMRIKIPPEYFALFSWFKKEPYGRVATLPDHSFWGWQYYKFGFQGAGFIWFGIKQPVLVRDFDRWSSKNENFYWEISYALYSGNKELFEKVLAKYQISYLLLDRNVISPDNPKSLYFERMEKLIGGSSQISLAASFGKIRVYKVNGARKTDKIYTTEAVRVEPSYAWGNFDRGYWENGDYYSVLGGSGSSARRLFEAGIGKNGNRQSKDGDRQTSKDISKFKSNHNLSAFLVKLQLKNQQPNVKPIPNSSTTNLFLSTKNTWPALSKILAKRSSSSEVKTDSLGKRLNKDIHGYNNKIPEGMLTVYYPFRSLFTGRRQKDLEFEVEDREEEYIINSKLKTQNLKLERNLIVPEMGRELVEVEKSDLGKILPKRPTIVFPEGKIQVRVPKVWGYLSYDSGSDFTLEKREPVRCDKFRKGPIKRGVVWASSLAASEELAPAAPLFGAPLSFPKRVLPPAPSPSAARLRKPQKFLRFYSQDASNCLNIDLPQLPHRLSYIVSVESRNIKGKPFLFSVINKNSRRADIETYLPSRVSPSGPSEGQSLFILPPMEEYGMGYTLHFDNISIGREETINDLGRITVNLFPYHFLQEIKFTSGRDDRLAKRRILLFGQSFDEGWKLYRIKNGKLKMKNFLTEKLSFIFGEEVKDHVLVNNWANGWLVEENDQAPATSYQLLYWPQYLQYLGFLFLLGSFGFIFINNRRS